MERTGVTASRETAGPGTDEESGGVKDQAQTKAKQAAGKAQEQVGQAADQAKGRVRDQVDQRSTQAGEQVSTAAGDARSVADELRKQGKDTPARYVEQAADRAERAGDWLRDSDGDRILSDVEDFARRNPWAVAAGGLALGFAASRLLKASSSDRYRASMGDGSYRRDPSSGGSPAGGYSSRTAVMVGERTDPVLGER